MFLLSHHPRGQLDRTVALGAVRVCARCLGTYPTLVIALVLQLLAQAPLESPLDPVLALGLVSPALVDWAWGCFDPRSGTNRLRLLTGALLGLSLARTLYVHLHRPYHPWLLAQLGLVAGVAIPVLVLTWRRK